MNEPADDAPPGFEQKEDGAPPGFNMDKLANRLEAAATVRSWVRQLPGRLARAAVGDCAGFLVVFSNSQSHLKIARLDACY
jgi:hypothetical protein